VEDKWLRLRLLITGASGLYGSKLANLAEKDGYKVFSIYNQHQAAFGTPVHLEISNEEQVEKTFKELTPEVVVHAATLTDVDKCELNRELAWKINVQGTENITRAAKTHNAFLLYISSDYIFNGEKGQYKETDSPDPINYYGITKLKAEEQVKTISSDYCIVRASVIYGATPAAGKVNFALWVLKSLKKGEKVRVLVDQWNSPTLNTNLAFMTLEIIERRLTGTFHLSGGTRISRYDFAQMIARTFNIDGSLIIPAKSEEFSWVAPRPRDSSLSTAKAKQMLVNKPLTIEHALEEMKQEMNELSNLGDSKSVIEES
jgi:dTDP-4-dehydrorhamnose reductase